MRTSRRRGWVGSPSPLTLHEQSVGHAAEGDDGTVAADEERSQLAVAAEPDRTLHVPFDRGPYPQRIDPPIGQSTGCEAHHDLGPTGQGCRPVRIERCPSEEGGDHADRALPPRCAHVDGYGHIGTGSAPFL